MNSVQLDKRYIKCPFGIIMTFMLVTTSFYGAIQPVVEGEETEAPEFFINGDAESFAMLLISHILGGGSLELTGAHNGEKFRILFENISNYVGYTVPLPAEDVDSPGNPTNEEIRDVWKPWLEGLKDKIEEMDYQIGSILKPIVAICERTIDIFTDEYNPEDPQLYGINISFSLPYASSDVDLDNVVAHLNVTFEKEGGEKDTYTIVHFYGYGASLILLPLLSLDLLNVNSSHRLYLSLDSGYINNDGEICSLVVTIPDLDLSSLDYTFAEEIEAAHDLEEELPIKFGLLFFELGPEVLEKYGPTGLIKHLKLEGGSSLASLFKRVSSAVAIFAFCYYANKLWSEVTEPHPETGQLVLYTIAAASSFIFILSSLGIISISTGVGLAIGIALILLTYVLFWWYHSQAEQDYEKCKNDIRRMFSVFSTQLLKLKENLLRNLPVTMKQVQSSERIRNIAHVFASHGEGNIKYTSDVIERVFYHINNAGEKIIENTTGALNAINETIYHIINPYWEHEEVTGETCQLLGIKSVPLKVYGSRGEYTINATVIEHKQEYFTECTPEYHWGFSYRRILYDEEIQNPLDGFYPARNNTNNFKYAEDFRRSCPEESIDGISIQAVYNDSYNGSDICTPDEYYYHFNSLHHTDIDTSEDPSPDDANDECWIDDYEEDAKVNGREFYHYKFNCSRWPNLDEETDEKINNWLIAVNDSYNVVKSYMLNITYLREYLENTKKLFSSSPIQYGLRWLEDNQQSDGSWCHDVAITSLATLAFLNYGYSQYYPVVSKAIHYILQNKHWYDGGSKLAIYNDPDHVTYHTSLALLVLKATHDPSYEDEIESMKNWLIWTQWDKNCRYGYVSQTHWYYGGWGYGRSYATRPDLSNTQWAMMALNAAGATNENDENVWMKAEKFVSRCQARDVTNDMSWANGRTSGGFIYRADGQTAAGGSINGYGSMTAAGIWGLRLAGVSLTDPRIEHSTSPYGGIDWIENHYSWESNPGTSPSSNVLYYYYVSLAKALVMSGKINLIVDGKPRDWKEDMIENISIRQHRDGNKGYWQGTSTGWENIKELATSFALLALETRTFPPYENLWMSIILASHADLHLYDSEGRHTGKIYDENGEWTGNIENEIPGSTYELVNGKQVINLSRIIAGNYRIELVGTSTGIYNLTVIGKQDEREVYNQWWEGEITEDMVHASNVIVTAMEGALTIFVSPPKVQPVLKVSPSVIMANAAPGMTVTNSFNVSSKFGDTHSVVIHATDIKNSKGDTIDGSYVSFDPNGFDVPIDEIVDVTMNISIPEDVRPMGDWTYTGRVIIESIDAGVRYIDLVVQLDNTPPITICNVGSPKYVDRNKWVTSYTPINLTATDDLSGVKATYFRIWFNNSWSEWMEYNGNFTLKGEGRHYLEYYSIDNAGNIEEAHNQTHFVDNTPPVTLVDIEYGDTYYTYDSETGRMVEHREIRSVTLTADDGNGVDHCTIYWAIKDQLGNLIWHSQPGSVTFKGDKAKEVVEFYSIDALGNQEPVRRADRGFPTE